MFNQNGKFGGYQSGAYDSKSLQPTLFNWTRQTIFSSIDNPKIKWSYRLGEKTSSSPVIGREGIIYFGGHKGNFYAIYPDGTLQWKLQLRGILATGIIGADNSIYVGSEDFNLYSLSPDGNTRWHYSTGGKIDFSPAIASDGTIYISSSNRTLNAITHDGHKKWEFKTDYKVNTPPIIAKDGTVYFGSYSDVLFALNSDGSFKWSSCLGTGSVNEFSPLIGADGTIYVVAFTNGDSILCSVSPEGLSKWTLKDVEIGPIFDLQGNLIVGGTSCGLLNINLNGEKLWATNIIGFLYKPPLICSDGIIYVVSTNKKGRKWYSWVEAFNPKGQQKWSITVPGYCVSSQAVGVCGEIYLLANDSENGYLYAIGD